VDGGEHIEVIHIFLKSRDQLISISPFAAAKVIYTQYPTSKLVMEFL